MKIVLCNVPVGRAAPLARTVVQEGLAACVNILPIRSIYEWQGSICEDAEETMLLKTDDSTASALVERLKLLHPYTLPEILVVDIDGDQSHGPYVDWVRKQCTRALAEQE